MAACGAEFVVAVPRRALPLSSVGKGAWKKQDIGATLSTVGRAQRCQTHAPDLSGEALLRLTSDTAGCFTVSRT